MKNSTLLFSCILCLLGHTLSAQSYPDSGFENNWQLFENNTPGKSDYWDFVDGNFTATLNQLYELSGDQGDAPLTAFREENAYEGNYALKLVSNTMIFGEPLFLPGAAGTISINFIDLACILGQAFPYRPLQFTGYYKYSPVKGDSAAIEVFLKKSGQIVGRGKMLVYQTVDTFTNFNIPIQYSSAVQPDSVVVIYAASAGYDFTSLETLMQCKGQDGSTLIVDGVAFSYQQGIKQAIMSENTFLLYPNPVKGKLSIILQKQIKGEISIYDYVGKEVKTIAFTGSTLEIDLSELAAGSYFVNLMENNHVMASKMFIKE
ncbi:MAG: T9SS type A sorting domain-containing protein [Bacteroidales bacterium]|nr:PCMD domain-containing protein [Bacteroidales bacterium]MDD2688182.1 PCMD domain-containing protein [Bacteroidales bacterium]MDD3330616.1 PCMD domain-containing protein [Bacteroidales bacterium]MDD4581658.1 PCMD domain-containing protein [Bacteroidales bacterium]